MVRGPPMVVEVCHWGPSKETEEKIKLKGIEYQTTAENLRVWKWHMTIVFHFLPVPTDFI